VGDGQFKDGHKDWVTHAFWVHGTSGYASNPPATLMGGQQSIKLCQQVVESMPEEKICDITVGPPAAKFENPSREDEPRFKKSGFHDFGFRRIGVEASGNRFEHSDDQNGQSKPPGGTLKKEFDSHGLHAGQMGATRVYLGRWKYGKSHNNYRDDECNYEWDTGPQGYSFTSEMTLYVTSHGCAIPKQPQGKGLTCVAWRRTEWAHTPYGPRDLDFEEPKGTDGKPRDLCSYEVTAEESGYCVCRNSDDENVYHAAKSAHSKVGGSKTFTCKDECESPSWVPPVSGVKMAYSKDLLPVKGQWDYEYKVKTRAKCGENNELGEAGMANPEAEGVDTINDPPIDGSNTEGYTEEIKYWQNIHGKKCKSLNTKWYKEPDTSILCMSREQIIVP